MYRWFPSRLGSVLAPGIFLALCIVALSCHPISGRNVDSPQIVVDPNGTATAVWLEGAGKHLDRAVLIEAVLAAAGSRTPILFRSRIKT